MKKVSPGLKAFTIVCVILAILLGLLVRKWQWQAAAVQQTVPQSGYTQEVK
jgi:hypothetical protein